MGLCWECPNQWLKLSTVYLYVTSSKNETWAKKGIIKSTSSRFAVSRSAKEWSNAQNALAYLNVADTLPHRSEGESVLLDHIPQNARRILDLGTGDGRLIRLIKSIRPEIEAVALDISPTMLKSAREHFANDSTVKVIEHDLSQPLPDLDYFDAIVSSFAIHHLKHERKQSLYEEVYDILNPSNEKFLGTTRMKNQTSPFRPIPNLSLY